MRNYEKCWLQFLTDFPTCLFDGNNSIPVYFASGSRVKVLGIYEQNSGGFYVCIGFLNKYIGFSDQLEEHQFQVEME